MMPEQIKKKDPLWRIFIIVIPSAFFLLTNLLYVYNAWFVRHRADDFCFSGTLREFGFFGGLNHFYLTLSNRFSAFILWSFSDLFGEKAIRFFPMLVIIFTSFSIYKFVRFIASETAVIDKGWIAFYVSQMLTFFFLYLSPSIHQSVYWRAAMVHYFLPFPVLLLMLCFALQKKNGIKNNTLIAALFFLLAFFLAGLSESFAALQGAVYSLLLFYYLIHPQRKSMSSMSYFALAAVFATMVALLVMIVSPGLTFRMTLLDQAQDVRTIISITMNSTLSFIFFTIRGQWLPFSVLFLLGCGMAIYATHQKPMTLKWKQLFLIMILIPLIVFVLIASIAAPTAYAMMAYPEKRVLMLALMILVPGIFSEGVLLGYILGTTKIVKIPMHILAGISVLILSIYPLFAISDIRAMINFYQVRADLWDQQQREILTQIGEGKKDLEVMALDAHAEIAEMREASAFWVNLCTAQYYNVDTISVIER